MEEAAWKRYLTDYNEGLGVVYERFVLNDFLLALWREYGIATVLEAPVFGMAGVSGINSVALARAGAQVTLIDDHDARLDAIRRIWHELDLDAQFIVHDRWMQLPFPDGTFDLAWNWAALWHLTARPPLPQGDRRSVRTAVQCRAERGGAATQGGGEGAPPAALLRELVRVSRRVVFVAVPNRVQVGYLLRKHLLERDFVNHVDESWADIGRVRSVLEGAGLRIVRQGVLDVPPWPDTVMPAAQVLERLGVRSKKLQTQFGGESWQWSTMDYYLGRQPDLYRRVMRYAWLDRAPIPWQLKAVWAHHRYVVGVKEQP